MLGGDEAAKPTDPKLLYGAACLVVAAVAAWLLRRERG
jgi:hypothetical protein